MDMDAAMMEFSCCDYRKKSVRLVSSAQVKGHDSSGKTDRLQAFDGVWEVAHECEGVYSLSQTRNLSEA